jgi:hypothetical protein
MKQIVIALGVVIVMFVLFSFRETLFTAFENTAEYQKVEVIEIVEELPAWQTDEEAIKAAQAVVDRKIAEARLEALQASSTALTATYKTDKEALDAEIEEVEKELGLY